MRKGPGSVVLILAGPFSVIIRPDDKPFMNSSIRKAIPKRNRIHYRAKSTNIGATWFGIIQYF
jgi:hypothetical protein